MKKTFEQRVDELEKIMENQSFWLRDGRANEVNYWVFDYPASKELAVREVNYWVFDYPEIGRASCRERV